MFVTHLKWPDGSKPGNPIDATEHEPSWQRPLERSGRHGSSGAIKPPILLLGFHFVGDTLGRHPFLDFLPPRESIQLLASSVDRQEIDSLDQQSGKAAQRPPVPRRSHVGGGPREVGSSQIGRGCFEGLGEIG